MGDVNYKPVIDDMVWSYSRINTFHSCPYQWYLKYLCGEQDKEMFFSSFGSFIHDLLDGFYSGFLSKEEAMRLYLTGFPTRVASDAPNAKVFSRYFSDGLRCVTAPPELPIHNPSTEQTVRFSVGGYPFTARIDAVGALPDGGIGVVDHKSRILKPRSGRKKPTVSDAELDSYLRQLYLYSAAVRDSRGEYPRKLFFNCFRGLRDRDNQPTGEHIIGEPFKEQALHETEEWAVQSIRTIRDTEVFRPDVDYFKCRYLCGVHDKCEYYQMNFGKEAN
jgi:hypothetical protein